MPALILFRHGKSDWDASYANDHERPLAERGREAAQCMGRLLQQVGQVPDLAISSSAARARDTLQLAARAGQWRCAMRIDSALYEAGSGELLRLLKSIDTPAQRLLLTGHEPTFSEFTSRLVGRARLRFPTAAMARIDFDCETWAQVDFGQGELRWLLPPKTVCRLKPRK
jgi:phosphohistidine phosphatase